MRQATKVFTADLRAEELLTILLRFWYPGASFLRRCFDIFSIRLSFWMVSLGSRPRLTCSMSSGIDFAKSDSSRASRWSWRPSECGLLKPDVACEEGFGSAGAGGRG